MIVIILSLSPFPWILIYTGDDEKLMDEVFSDSSSDTRTAESYNRIIIVLSRIPIFVFGGADSNALKSFSRMVSRVIFGSLMRGTFDAINAIDCMEISPSATYQR